VVTRACTSAAAGAGVGSENGGWLADQLDTLVGGTGIAELAAGAGHVDVGEEATLFDW
jgi:hypothetical protein